MTEILTCPRCDHDFEESKKAIENCPECDSEFENELYYERAKLEHREKFLEEGDILTTSDFDNIKKDSLVSFKDIREGKIRILGSPKENSENIIVFSDTHIGLTSDPQEIV